MSTKLPFSMKTKMADIIHTDYRLIPIIGRFGIEYGFGNKMVYEVCLEYDINAWFFLEIINSYHDSQYFPSEQLQNFTAQLIIHYLSNTHAYYLQSKVPEIQGYIDKMEQEVTTEHQINVKLLNDFFRKYCKELASHLDIEENKVFPYILKLENALESGVLSDELIDHLKHESITVYEWTHDNLEVKLSDLKNLIIKYLPPVLCKELCQKLLTELYRLESDLENHARIEDKVLVPKVKLLEKKALEINEKQ